MEDRQQNSNQNQPRLHFRTSPMMERAWRDETCEQGRKGGSARPAEMSFRYAHPHGGASRAADTVFHVPMALCFPRSLAADLLRDLGFVTSDKSDALEAQKRKARK